ncbi:MAG TPA: phospholipid-binding protein, partial [Burkholderiaceae bacterium]|nr:phospholipid-binding protein [Burkholderiaceae bacterium]
MKLTSESFTDQGNIPERNAFGKIDGQNHVALAGNANPHLA